MCFALPFSRVGPRSVGSGCVCPTVCGVRCACAVCGVRVRSTQVFTGISFKSIMVPIRSVLTTSLTLAFTYGSVSLIYGVRSVGSRESQSAPQPAPCDQACAGERLLSGCLRFGI
jgi:hypothetical protein